MGRASLSAPLPKVQDLVLGFEQIMGAPCATVSTGVELKLTVVLEQKDKG